MSDTAVEAPTSSSGAPPTADTAPRVIRRRWWHANWLGLVGAVLAFGASITPSLLPRPWLLEGVICGLGAALGYGLGTYLSWILRKFHVREPSAAAKRLAWRALILVGSAITIFWLLIGVRWQNQVRTLVGMSDQGYATAIQVAVMAVPTFILTVLFWRWIFHLTGRLRRFLDRFIPRFVTGAIALGVVALLFYLAISGLLLSGFLNLMDTVYAGNNTGTDPGAVQPTTPLRSGSSASLVSWQSLGRQGRNFVGRGPTPAQLTTFSGQPALEPIRVYVGLDSADSAGTRADLAVKELERTGAFNRKILVVTGVTGTGWLEPQSVDSLEYEWNGDSAIVGIQYSYLPSWIATLVDVDRARDAGRELFNAVYLRWSQLPAGHRPKLISYGLSLGSFAAQAPFTSPDDVTTRTQGAVFAGSPGFSEPWGTVTAGREPGSPQWQPTYFGGQRFRFAAAPSDLSKLPGVWGPPRVAYLQHANDPVVWWSGRLLWQRPDWLREPAGPGRTPVMAWYPVLTFLQVTVDQFVGVSVPNGQGHNYGTAMPTAWAAVTQPPGWTSADTSRLDEIIAAYAIE